MPVFGNLVINDGASTPVAHTFAPAMKDGQQAMWTNNAASIPIGKESLTFTVRMPPRGNSTAAIRVTGKLTLPVVAPVDGLDDVVRSSSFDFAFNIAQTATLQNRKDIAALVKNFFANPAIVSAVESTESFY